MTKPKTGPNMDRRNALKVIGAGATYFSAAYGVAPATVKRFHKRLAQGPYDYSFFRPPELETIRVLADMIIPRDDRSGSATDAGTVEYMDFVLYESSVENQLVWRDGLAWLDAECGRRFEGRHFVGCTDSERTQILDDIAWPRRASETLRDQVRWLNRVRDLVGSGFFSSEMGVRDVGYIGNMAIPEWRGAPREALEELGVSYEEWDRRYGGQR